MNILQAVADPKVFAGHFRGSTWDAWKAFLAALFALPMNEQQLELYRKHTGRTAAPTTPLHEAWLCIGRRGGKSFILAVIAVFLACFKDWRPYLGPGEVGTIMVVCADRRQARTIMRFALGLLRAVPMLKRQIEGVTQESITLKNNIVLEVHTCNYKSTRGYSVVAALLDEIAYWPTDEYSSSPDVEVVAAIRPSMATVPGAMLLCASSPHARKGLLWTTHKKHFGKDNDPVLVWQAATRDMNASVPQSYIDQHMADDPARGSAEWLAQFRTDVEAFCSLEAVRSCISVGMFERLPQDGVHYRAFLDCAGGSGSDSMVLCCAHRDKNDVAVIDCLREVKPPFSPADVCAEFSTVLKSYRVDRVVGDKYAGSWPVERFDEHNIRYEPCARSKADLYVDFLPSLNSGKVQLLDNERLVNQLISLERRTTRGTGRDVVDHPPSGHDDLCNCVAGVVAELANSAHGYVSDLSWVGGPGPNEQPSIYSHPDIRGSFAGQWWIR